VGEQSGMATCERDDRSWVSHPSFASQLVNDAMRSRSRPRRSFCSCWRWASDAW